MLSSFFSFYHRVTYLPPIDTSEPTLKGWELSQEDMKKTIQIELNDPIIRECLGTPLTYDPQICDRYVTQLASRGWKILSQKPIDHGRMAPYYGVFAKEKGTVILKHAGKKKPFETDSLAIQLKNGEFYDFHQRSSLLRVAMAQKVRTLCSEKKEKLEGIIAPQKWLCPFDATSSLPLMDRYIVVAERVDCLTIEETFDAITEMSTEEQKNLAKKLCYLAKKTGLEDFTFTNIRLGKKEDCTEDGVRKIYVIDTEPSNTMIPDQGIIWNFFTL